MAVIKKCFQPRLPLRISLRERSMQSSTVTRATVWFLSLQLRPHRHPTTFRGRKGREFEKLRPQSSRSSRRGVACPPCFHVCVNRKKSYVSNMPCFDYSASAELFSAQGRWRFRYRPFTKAAEAIRYATEELPANMLMRTRFKAATSAPIARKSALSMRASAIL